jgi:hypothetical protein
MVWEMLEWTLIIVMYPWFQVPNYQADVLRHRYLYGEHDNYFVQKYNAARELAFSHLQKVTTTLRMLAYGGPADSLDEYLRMAESTVLELVKYFVRAIVEIYGPHYLRAPNEEEITALLQIAEARGFPEMVGSIACMHWSW